MSPTRESGYELCYMAGKADVFQPATMPDSGQYRSSHESRWLTWGRTLFALAVVCVLLVLGVANVVTRARSHEIDDGVLWAASPNGVTAVEIADGTPAALAGVERGDVLVAVNGSPVQTLAAVVGYQHRANEGAHLAYTLL